jgi:hypothetical protein
MNPHHLPAIERVLALLPEDGRRVLFGEVMARARRDLHLSAGNAGALLSELCTARRAAVETRDGYQWARRVAWAIDFPLCARPRWPVPRLRRPQPVPATTRRAA